MSDGTVVFYINDTLNKHGLGDIVMKPMDKANEHEYLVPLDGQTLDAAKYKRLIDYLGTNTLPNLTQRYLRMDTTPGQMVDAGLPNIQGDFNAIQTDDYPRGWVRGAFTISWQGKFCSQIRDGNNNGGNIVFNASLSNPIYGASNTVTPLTYTVRAYICYA